MKSYIKYKWKVKKYHLFLKFNFKVLSKIGKYDIINMLSIFYGDVAQLARATGSYPVGREFESPRRYHLEITRFYLVFIL